MFASSINNTAMQAFSDSGLALSAHSNSNRAVSGSSSSGIGVIGVSNSRAVVGTVGLISCAGTYAVGGCGAAATGVYGNGQTQGVKGTLGAATCNGEYAVGGCAGVAVAAGVYGRGSTVGVLAHADGNGDIFRGVYGAAEERKARIGRTGRGYFNDGTQTGGADYAESLPSVEDQDALVPGDVLTLDAGGRYGVRRANSPVSTLVVGVYSERPAILAVGDHHIDDPLTGEVPVALLGVVPTKASAENGPIAVGDLLVTASTPGHAMRAEPAWIDGVAVYPTGAILGKALQPLPDGTGKILVMVMPR